MASIGGTDVGPIKVAWVRATGSALCAMLVGIGFARFAYAPLMPALIEASWFSPSEAAYLGAANLAGYLVGALIGRPLTAHVPVIVPLRWMMCVVGLSFLACAAPVAFSWFFFWRFASGLAGGVLMVLAAPAVLPLVPVHRRGLASGIIFTGVGLGIAASGTLTPALLSQGLAVTWEVLGGLCLALTLLAWKGWPAEASVTAAKPATSAGEQGSVAAVKLLYVSYGLVAAGLVPHMIFLVDFVARGLGFGLEIGSAIWVLFGAGAVCGPILAGRIADRIGFGSSLRGAIFLLFVCNVWLAMSPDMTAVVVSSLLVGAFVPGITSLALGRVHELLPDAPARNRAWSIATIAFSILQAFGAYTLSYIFATTGGAYAPLFAAAAAAAGLSLIIEFVSARLLHNPAQEPQP